MAGQKQHVDIHRKLDLRRRLLTKAVPGAAYVPYIGDGDIAGQLYADRRIFGTDLDPDRVASARYNLAELGADATVEIADADGPFPFTAPETPAFAVADLDAYSYPYEAFRQWWATAPKTDRVVVFGTDGQRFAIREAGKTASCRLPDGTKNPLFGEKAERQKQARELFNKWVTGQVKPWLKAVATEDGWRVVQFASFTRDSMVYWGAVLERLSPTSPDSPTPKKPRGFAGVADDLLDVLAAGATLDAAAEQVGFTARTVQRYAAKNPDYRRRLDATLDARERGYDPKFDEEMRGQFLEALRDGKRVTTAARTVGIDPRTVKRHRAADPDFDALCSEAATEADDKVEDALFDAAVSGNVVAAQVWLYNRRPDRWTDKRSRGQEAGNAATPTPEGAADATVEPEDWLAEMLTRAGPGAVDLVGQLEQMFTPPDDAPAADTGS